MAAGEGLIGTQAFLESLEERAKGNLMARGEEMSPCIEDFSWTVVQFCYVCFDWANQIVVMGEVWGPQRGAWQGIQ